MEENDLLKIKIEQARAQLPKETRDAIDAVDWKMPILEFREANGYSFTQLDDLEIETELLLCGLTSPENYPIELGQRMGLPKQEIEKLVTVMNQKVFQKIRQELVKISAQKEKMKTTNSVQVEPKPLEQKIEVNPTAQKIEIKKEPEKKEVGTVIEVMAEELPMGGKEAEDTEREQLLKSIENPRPTPAHIAPATPPAPKIQTAAVPATLSREKILQTKIPTPDFLPSKKLFNSFQSQETKTEHSINSSSQASTPAAPKTEADSSPKQKIDPYREIPE